jgi:hypothetical protein
MTSVRKEGTVSAAAATGTTSRATAIQTTPFLPLPVIRERAGVRVIRFEI